MLHSLLRRQLRRHFGSTDVPADLAGFVDAVNRAYGEFDQDRLMLERSLDLSSRELLQANAEMRAVFRAFPDILIRLDRDGLVHDCRGGDFVEVAIPPERWIGRHLRDVLAPEVADAFEGAMRSASETHVPVSIEYTIEQDGRRVVHEARVLSGLENQVVAVVRDITERKRAEEEAGRQRAFLRQVIDLNPSFVFAKDRAGRFTLVNESVADAYGTTVEGLLGRTDADFNPNAEEVEAFRHDDLAVMDSGVDLPIPEEAITDAHGRKRWLQTIKRAIRGEDGQVSHVLGVSVDITARREAEANLRRRTESLLRKQAVLEDLAHMMAPDLNGALASLTAAAARALDVSRVSVWLFNEDDSISCAHLSVEGASVPTDGLRFAAADFPYYVEAVRNSRAIAADDAHEDARTREFGPCYFTPNLIASVLDIPVRAHGRLVGVMSHEHVGAPRAWTLEETDLAASIADFVTLHIEADRRRAVEHQLRQSQKMEAIGLLAGGVAHDFNNLLSVITGYAEFARDGLGADHPVSGDLQNVLDASRRAAELTKKLLTFSRHQLLRVEPVDVRVVMDDFSRLLSRVMGEDVDVVLRKPARPLPVMADRSQLDQVLLNLCTNARQAMPRGGTLEISIASVRLSDDEASARHLRAGGDFAELRVTDTGIGMSSEVIERLWEPFFTTKEAGTGLGLAVVYGIIEQHHGAISVRSEPGAGSTFSVLIPLLPHDVPVESAPAPAELLRGTETLLVVEDEDTLRRLLVLRLEGLGYRVIAAADGRDAIARVEQQPDIRLAILDVVMPQIGGPDAFRRMRERIPGLAAVFASGYAPEDSRLQEILDSVPETMFIPKPFVIADLSRAIRQLIDA